jgi:hypothetical protein
MITIEDDDTFAAWMGDPPLVDHKNELSPRFFQAAVEKRP